MDKKTEIIFECASILNASSLKWWLEGGTLLGAVRDHRPIPWDDDIDFSLFSSDRDIFESSIVPYLLSQGYEFVNSFKMPITNGGEYTFKKNNINIDFFFLWKDESNLFLTYIAARKTWVSHEFASNITERIIERKTIKTEDGEEETLYYSWVYYQIINSFPENLLTSLVPIMFCNALCYIPINYRAYLKQKYGDWEKPVTKYSADIHEKATIERKMLTEDQLWEGFNHGYPHTWKPTLFGRFIRLITRELKMYRYRFNKIIRAI